MKKALPVFLILALYTLNAAGQKVNLLHLPAPAHEGIRVEKLAGDSLTSSFLIDIMDVVPLHYHQMHSEHVYVLSGEAMMQLGDSLFKINAGDYIFIPANTPHSARNLGAIPLRVLSIQCPEFDGSDRILVR